MKDTMIVEKIDFLFLFPSSFLLLLVSFLQSRLPIESSDNEEVQQFGIVRRLGFVGGDDENEFPLLILMPTTWNCNSISCHLDLE